LLAGKIRAVLTRQFTKGRDWYDLLWYLAKRPPLEPNLAFLEQALAQEPALFSGQTATEWRSLIMQKLHTLDWTAVTRDVQPFLEHPGDIHQMSKPLLEQLLAPKP